MSGDVYDIWTYFGYKLILGPTREAYLYIGTVQRREMNSNDLSPKKHKQEMRKWRSDTKIIQLQHSTSCHRIKWPTTSHFVCPPTSAHPLFPVSNALSQTGHKPTPHANNNVNNQQPTTNNQQQNGVDNRS